MAVSMENFKMHFLPLLHPCIEIKHPYVKKGLWTWPWKISPNSHRFSATLRVSVISVIQRRTLVYGNVWDIPARGDAIPWSSDTLSLLHVTLAISTVRWDCWADLGTCSCWKGVCCPLTPAAAWTDPPAPVADTSAHLIPLWANSTHSGNPGEKKFRFSLGFGNWISLPGGHGTISAVSCSGRGEYGFASSTDNQLFDHFSYLTWLHPKIRHWNKTKGPFFKWKCSCTHCLNIRFPTCVTLLQYRGADGLCWREDRVFSPVIQNASLLPF